MPTRLLSRFGVIAALLLMTVAIVNAQDAPLPLPDVQGRGAFQTPVPFYVPPEYQSRVRDGFTVTSTLLDEDNGTCGGGAGVSLREALLYCGVAGGRLTVAINPGIYNLNSVIHVPLFESLVILGGSPDTVTIRSAGAPGAGAGGLFVFTIADSPLTLMNLTLENGNVASLGGAIFLEGYGQVDFFNTVFRGNSADIGGAVYFGTDGGSILASLRYSTFEDNQADEVGAALRFLSEDVNGNHLLVSNSLFKDNTADGTSCIEGGGAIAMAMTGGYGNAVTIENSTFEGNDALCGTGGAVNVAHQDGAMAVTINDSTFTDNSAAGTNKSGGAVFVYNPFGSVDIHASTFTGNSAIYGGAVDVTSAHRVAIDYSRFDGNSADVSGGALYIVTEFSVLITDSTLINNDAGGGGGAAILSANPLTISGNLITNNTANQGGGLYFVSPAGTIQQTALADNTATEGPDCFIDGAATLLSLGGNRIGSTADCLYFAQTGDQVNNLLVNGGFERPQVTPAPSESIPAGWTVKNSSGDKRVCNTETKQPAVVGNCAFVFTGSTGTNASISQSIPPASLDAAVGDDLLLSTIGSGVAASNVKLTLTVMYSGPTPTKVKKKVSFNGATNGWVYAATEPLDLTSLGIAGITVKVSDKSTSGKFYLDLLFLTVQPAPAPRGESRDVMPPPPAPNGFRGGN